MKTQRQYEKMFGVELQNLIAREPIAWVPLGPLEKHGEHLPWGLDASKAHAQCLHLAEKFGGVVLPPTHVAGIHDPWCEDPVRYKEWRAEVGNWYVRPETLRMLIEDILDGLENIGFKTIILNTGHYPALQGKLHKEIVAQKQPNSRARLIAFDEDDALPMTCDHAGTYETSMFMALGLETHLERLSDEQKNVIGYWREKTPPHKASVELGRKWLAMIEAHFEKLLKDNSK